MSKINITQKIDNWFKARGFLTKTGVLLITLTIVLYTISYARGIQVLMFLPALVFSIFVYSFIDVYIINRRSIKAEWRIINQQIHLFIYWQKNIDDSFFQLAYDDGNNNIDFISPNTNLLCEKRDKHGQYYLLVKGKLDVFRYIIPLKSKNLNDKFGKKFNDLNTKHWQNMYIHLRPFIEGDEFHRIDHLQSAKRDNIYVKDIIWEDDKQKNDKNSSKNNQLQISSNYPLTKRQNVEKGEIIEWLMIILAILVIHLEWLNIFFTVFALVLSGLIAILTYFYDIKIRSKIFMTIIIAIPFIFAFYEFSRSFDALESAAHFLVIVAILKHFFARLDRDAFTYVFLILFVFVDLAIFTIKSWFIIFFTIFLGLALAIFSIYAGGDLKEHYQESFGRPKTKSSWFKMFITIFMATIIFFFVLPHGNKKQDDLKIFKGKESSTIKSGFDEEVSLNNIQELKNDFTKKIVIMNAHADRINEYKSLYWRGMRFNYLKNDHWQKIKGQNKFFINSKISDNSNETWQVKYYFDSETNVFLPKSPLKILPDSFYSISGDNTIFKSSRTRFLAKTLNITFKNNKDGIIEANSSSLNINNLDIKISPENELLFKAYWQKIPQNIHNDPVALTNYVKYKSGFSYELEQASSNLYNFLYQDKKGYCEFYATVLAVTLQHFGHPATLVNGYMGGEWNDPAQAWIIRGVNAHSWVEILNQSGNWQIFDPTPQSSDLQWFKRINIIDTIIQYYDVIELKWYNYIVEYTGDDQKELWQLIKKNYLIVILTIILCFSLWLIKNYFFYIFWPWCKKTPSEKFMWWLKNKTKTKFFILHELSHIYPDLVSKTRAIIYGDKSHKHDLKKLKKEWIKKLK